MTQSSPHLLTSLSTREAIVDAMSRALIACDRNDPALFESAFAGEDVAFEINDGEKKVIPGLSFIRMHVFDQVGPMDTTHTTSNIRVDVKDGADNAILTAVSLAQHCPPGRGKEPDGPKYLVGGVYSVDMIKDSTDGVWKIKKWALNINWAQGDPSVMQSMQRSAAGHE